ncbi:MAG: hypothetical protein ACOX5R_06370 [bacterium]|jgi:hypothetical protein
MSKRRDEYEKSIERLCQFLELFYQDGYPPTKREIEDELHAIHALRPIPVNIYHEVDPRIREQNRFFFLLNEHYNRYDDVLPESVDLIVLPAQEDDPRMIQRELTLRQMNAFF